MREVDLRIHSGKSSPGDLKVTVQDKTFDYLMTTITPEVRVSAYLDRDYPKVEAMYAELFVSDSCPYEATVTKLTPGSKEREQIKLPGLMKNGEQLVLIVSRKPRAK